MTERDLLSGYFCSGLDRIESEMNELRNRIRFRRIGIEDTVEMMLTMQRLDDFKEFSRNVCAILHLSKD
ncbi:MAG: hypothetical protein ACI4J3_07855 [Oscillospiraceae bacterium]